MTGSYRSMAAVWECATQARWTRPCRPVSQRAYGVEDLAALAAAYSFDIARNHPFVDGNKRTAWVISRLFLAQNGVLLRYGRQDAIDTVLRLVAGELDEEGLTHWLRERFADLPGHK